MSTLFLFIFFLYFISWSWFYRIMFHFHISINNIRFTLSSISNGLLLWPVILWLFHQSQSLKFSKTLNCMVLHLTNQNKILRIKVYNTLDFCCYWLSTKLHCTETISNTSRLGTFSPFFVLSINFFVLPNNFIVSGVWIYCLYSKD